MEGIKLEIVSSICIFDGGFWATFIEEHEQGCKINDKYMNYVPDQDKCKGNSSCWAKVGTKLRFFCSLFSPET